MLLATSYLTPAQFLASPSDYDFSSYNTAQLQSILVAASAQADSIMHRTYLAQERTIRYNGSGLRFIELEEKPLLYVKRFQLTIPGQQGQVVSGTQLLIDYEQGSMLNCSTMYWQANPGYMFSRNAPVDVTLGWGCGYTVAVAPAYTTVDTPGSGLTAGTYNIAVTAKTFYGETTAVVKTVTTVSGSIAITPTPGLGVYVYRAYMSPASGNTTLSSSPVQGATSFTVTAPGGVTIGSQWLLGSGSLAEQVTISNVVGSTVTVANGLTNAHSSGEAFIPLPLLVGESQIVAYGNTPLQINVNSLLAPLNYWQDTLPLVDTSAPPVPAAILEATRLLSLSRIFEQNNKSNQGIQNVVEGDKRLTWRSTEGNSGRGTPFLVEEASNLLAPYALNGIYFA